MSIKALRTYRDRAMSSYTAKNFLQNFITEALGFLTSTRGQPLQDFEKKSFLLVSGNNLTRVG